MRYIGTCSILALLCRRYRFRFVPTHYMFPDSRVVDGITLEDTTCCSTLVFFSMSWPPARQQRQRRLNVGLSDASLFRFPTVPVCFLLFVSEFENFINACVIMYTDTTTFYFRIFIGSSGDFYIYSNSLAFIDL